MGLDTQSQPSPVALSAAWDWYACTLPEEVNGGHATEALHSVLGGEVISKPGRHAYAVRNELVHGRRVVASVSFGGGQPRPLIESTGGDANRVTPTLRRLWPAHRVTRCDSALDFDSPGAWNTLSGEALRVARMAGVKTRVAGDWLAGVDGRTLYVGGRTSSVQVRVYEKGIQQGESPDWVRVEQQTRPEKAQKALYSTLTPQQVWGASPWCRRLAESILRSPIDAVPRGGSVTPDDVRARRALVTQYGGTLGRWLVEVGGDPAILGQALVDYCREVGTL